MLYHFKPLTVKAYLRLLAEDNAFHLVEVTKKYKLLFYFYKFTFQYKKILKIHENLSKDLNDHISKEVGIISDKTKNAKISIYDAEDYVMTGIAYLGHFNGWSKEQCLELNIREFNYFINAAVGIYGSTQGDKKAKVPKFNQIKINTDRVDAIKKMLGQMNIKGVA